MAALGPANAGIRKRQLRTLSETFAKLHDCAHGTYCPKFSGNLNRIAMPHDDVLSSRPNWSEVGGTRLLMLRQDVSSAIGPCARSKSPGAERCSRMPETSSTRSWKHEDGPAGLYEYQVAARLGKFTRSQAANPKPMRQLWGRL